jgi:hypothetical protein
MNLTTIGPFAASCERLGITIPEPITRGLHLIDVARAHERKPSGSLLDLSDDELRDRVTALAIRQHDGGRGSTLGMAPGVEIVLEQLGDEVRASTLPYLEQMIVDLQPAFEEAAISLVIAAQRHGITYATSTDTVIDQAPEVIEAYRAGKRAWIAMQPIATFRKLISTTFGLAPHDGYGADFSVLFAAGDNWGYDGRYYLEGKTQSHLDWYALAAGGLRLNGLTDVETKLRERRAKDLAAAQRSAPHARRVPGAPVADDGAVFPMPTFPRG